LRIYKIEIKTAWTQRTRFKKQEQAPKFDTKEREEPTPNIKIKKNGL